MYEQEIERTLTDKSRKSKSEVNQLRYEYVSQIRFF